MLTSASARVVPDVPAASPASAAPPLFDEVYEQNFAFVGRNLRRLGVSASEVDDAAQEVFLVVHRRLGEFAGRSSVRTWLFGIVARVASGFRRTSRRKKLAQCVAAEDDGVDVELLANDRSGNPHEHLTHREAVERLHGLLERLEDQKRTLFVLVEIEQMSMPEAVVALGINLNTGYSRLRSARREMEEACQRTRMDEQARAA